MAKKEKTYDLWVPYHTGISVKVKAASEEEAIERAKYEVENGGRGFNDQLLRNVQRDGAIDIVGES